MIKQKEYALALTELVQKKFAQNKLQKKIPTKEDPKPTEQKLYIKPTISNKNNTDLELH